MNIPKGLLAYLKNQITKWERSCSNSRQKQKAQTLMEAVKSPTSENLIAATRALTGAGSFRFYGS